MHGLYLYDYGFRQYDPLLCRFTQMDRKCEDYYNVSLYVYCLNNPVINIDPDGNGVWTKLGKFVYRAGKAVAKNGLSALNQADTYACVFSDVTDAYDILTDDNASMAEKVMAGVSLATEVLPVSVGDVKEAGKIVGKLSHNEKLRESAKIGQEAHRQIEKDLRDIFGAKTEIRVDLPKISVRKDAQLPDGKYVIIKPKTQSGQKAAKQREKLMKENGKETITIYYDPNNPSFQPESKTYIGPQKY